MDLGLYKIGVFGICQVRMDDFVGTSNPQVAGSIPAEGATSCFCQLPLHHLIFGHHHRCKNLNCGLVDVRRIGSSRTKICITVEIMKFSSRRVHYVAVLMTVIFLASCSSKESGVSRSDSSKETVAEKLCDLAAGKIDCDMADLSKQSLDGLILAGGSFQNANFTYASLKGTNFDGANLRGAKFDHADLSGANLSRTLLHGSSFQYADLYGAKIQDVCLAQVNFDFSDLTSADFARSGGADEMTATDSNLTESKNFYYFEKCK